MDPVSGEPTDALGGYRGVAEWVGYPPYAAAALASKPAVRATAVRVFAELGARMTVAHGRSWRLGDTLYGLAADGHGAGQRRPDEAL